jgi:hypothetical protein
MAKTALEYITDNRGVHSNEVVDEAYKLLTYRFLCPNWYDAIAKNSSKEARLFHRNALSWGMSHGFQGDYKDAYSFGHEVGHLRIGAEGIFSAQIQYEQAGLVHYLLETITTTPQLPL